jgi:hypothetical protein
MLRIALAAIVATLAAGGAARACVKDFPSDRAQADYYAARAAQAHDVVLGQVVDVIAVPAPGESAVIQGDATVVVLKVRKGSRAAGDRIVVPVRKDPRSKACGWGLPTLGATYELYLAFNAARGEYRVLDTSAAATEVKNGTP